MNKKIILFLIALFMVIGSSFSFAYNPRSGGAVTPTRSRPTISVPTQFNQNNAPLMAGRFRLESSPFIIQLFYSNNQANNGTFTIEDFNNGQIITSGDFTINNNRELVLLPNRNTTTMDIGFLVQRYTIHNPRTFSGGTERWVYLDNN
ncbi:MAG: hypothetical protein FWE37_03335 [Spirochaetaceae bacterium]|nr:hypothetical protein [Spirochaetaceae bacterium]